MKYLKYFESFMFTEVPSSEKEFLDLAKRLDPDKYNIYYTLFIIVCQVYFGENSTIISSFSLIYF